MIPNENTRPPGPHDLKIEIRGAAGAGKTHLQHWLAGQLKRLGAEVVLKEEAALFGDGFGIDLAPVSAPDFERLVEITTALPSPTHPEA